MLTAAQLKVLVTADTDQAMKGLGGLSALLTPGGALGIGLAAAAAATVGIGVASLKMAADFQTGVVSLVTGAGESRANLKMVSDGILKMADDTGTSTAQLTAGMYMIESAGYHGAAGLDVLKAAAQGAKVGQADLGTVADATTTIMKDYADSGINASGAVNTLIQTVAAGKTHMADLSGALAQILPTASAAHVGLNDVMAAMATMTGEGVPAANAATYLRQTLLALDAPSKGTVKALADVGLKASDVSASMQKSLPDTLKMITDAVGKKFPEGSSQYVEAIKNIAGGSKQMQGVLDLTGQHMKDFQSNTSNIGDTVKKSGATIAGWSDVQGTFNFQMDRGKEAVKGVMIQMGEKLLPVATQLAKEFADHLPGAIHAVEGAFKTAVDTGQKVIKFFQDTGPAATAVKMVLVVLGGAMAGLATYGIVQLVTALIGSIPAWITMAGAAWTAAAGVIAATWPFLLIGAAIAALGIGIYELVTHWSQVKQFFENLAHIVGDTFSKIGAWVHTKFDEIKSALGNALKAAWQIVVTIMTDIVNAYLLPIRLIVAGFEWLYNHNYFFKNLVDSIMKFIGELRDWLIATWGKIQEFTRLAWEHIQKDAQLAWLLIKKYMIDPVTDTWKLITTTVGGWASWLSGKWNEIVGTVKMWWSNISSSVTSGAKGVLDVVNTNFIKPVSDVIGNIVKSATDWGKNLIGNLISGITAKAGDVKNAAGNIAKGLSDMLGFHSPTKEGPGASADVWAPNLMKMFADGLRSSGPQVSAAARDALMGVQGALSGRSASGALSLSGAGVASSGAGLLAPAASALAGASAHGTGQPVVLVLDGRAVGHGILPYTVGAIRTATGFRG